MASSDSTPIQLPLAIDGLTVEIPLTRGFVTVVDAIDADLAYLKWIVTSADPRIKPYAYRHKGSVNGKSKHERMHRVILERILNRPLGRGEMPDHIDGNGLNNRRTNLRLATQAQNNANSKLKSTNTSGYKGIVFLKDENRWRAHISVNGKRIVIGRYKTAEEAHEAYCKAAQEHFGEFARFE